MRWLFILSWFAVVTVARPADHVVVLVWDGLRPDSVNEKDTPTLAKLAKEGTFFANHHAAFLSSTVVNGVAIATGCFPAHNGICANNEYRPSLNAQQPTSTAEPQVAQALLVPTLAEIIQRAGHRTVVAGAKNVARVHDPKPQTGSINLIEGNASLPESVLARVTTAQGKCPLDSTLKDDWTTRALIGPLWDGGVPKYSLLWLCEPDFTEHEHGPGSAKARAALRNSDHNLARVLEELDARGARKKTDIFVVSDHGFSTISRTVDIAAALRKAGFRAERKLVSAPVADDILAIGNGTVTLLYVIGRAPATVQRVVNFLQQQDFTGVILTREPMKGTFTLNQVHLNTPTPPDIVVSLRWNEDKNTAGLPGMNISDSSMRGVGQGAHGGLSRFEMHNTLIAAGPDFTAGLTNVLPSSNADLAPTVLHVLGLKPASSMDGRVLQEAFKTPPAKFSPLTMQTLEAANVHATARWTQYLRVSEFEGIRYVDEGNGAATPK